MVGAIVGDIAGSRFEFCNLKSGVMVVVMMLAASIVFADDVNYKDVKSAEAALLPATPHALTRDGRLALAKKLKPNEDKGFTVMGSSETEEHPIGSPHAPDGEGWEHDGRKHTKSTFFDSRRVIKEG